MINYDTIMGPQTKLSLLNITSHPASKASLKNPSEIECLEADSAILICDIQYDAEANTLNLR